jgi:hypothetical protein
LTVRKGLLVRDIEEDDLCDGPLRRVFNRNLNKLRARLSAFYRGPRFFSSSRAMRFQTSLLVLRGVAAIHRQAAMAEKFRLYWVDFAKGVGIILVVIGHVWYGLHNGGIAIPEKLDLGVERWIYSFHMPLFFFIAGLFAISSMGKAGKVFLSDKLATIGYPYVLWSLIHGGLEIAARSIAHQADSGLNWKELLAQIISDPRNRSSGFCMCC